MSSIFHNAAAMAPFFDDVIVVEGVRASTPQPLNPSTPQPLNNSTSQPLNNPTIQQSNNQTIPQPTRIRGTFRACVIDNGFADPVAAGDAESSVRTYTIVTPAGEWLAHTPPQTGDRITLSNGRHLAVQAINSIDAADWTITAKEQAK